MYKSFGIEESKAGAKVWKGNQIVKKVASRNGNKPLSVEQLKEQKWNVLRCT